jgi:trk system potassium uptake protein TrkA
MAQRIFILGAGRFGIHLAARLSELGCEVVLADKDTNRVEELAEDGFNTLEMDVEDEDALKQAGVCDADAVVVSIGENIKGSVLATLILKELQVKKIIARAIDAKHAQVLEKLGANLVVLPSRDMAYRLAERLHDHAMNERHPLAGDYQLTEVRLNSTLQGQTLAEARIPKQYGLTVVLLSRLRSEKEAEVLEPTPNLEMQEGDVLTVVGRKENINRFEKDCCQASS